MTADVSHPADAAAQAETTTRADATTQRSKVITEPLGPGMTRIWELDDVLFETTTDYQHVVIARTAQGITLFCDSDRQSTEYSQHVYHEALLVPALLLAERVRRVLIIGSSEGVASQMAVSAGAESVDHIDIDAVAVRACAEHLPYGYTLDELAEAEAGQGAVRVRYADGWDFLRQVKDSGDRYDLVVVDLPDEQAEGSAQQNRLYDSEFLGRCAEVCEPDGVVAYQAGCATMWRNTTLLRAWQRFRNTFGTTVYFGSDEHEWSFLFGRQDQLEQPTERMIRSLRSGRYRPESIDEQALRSRTVPPYQLRYTDTPTG